MGHYYSKCQLLDENMNACRRVFAEKGGFLPSKKIAAWMEKFIHAQSKLAWSRLISPESCSQKMCAGQIFKAKFCSVFSNKRGFK